MTKRKLPELQSFEAREGVDFEVTPQALQRWNPAIRAAKDDGAAAEISVYGFIGETWDGSGITAARIAGILRNVGKKDVVVNINSPGGSAFEGIAIYNLLRAHDGEVTVRVMGLAASAASIIAMAGDRIEMGRAAFLMIHNVLMLAIGNRNDLRDAADMMEPIDRALADLYAARTGNKADAISEMMDKETWLGGTDAVDQGFADALMDDAAVTEDDEPKKGAAKARAQLQAVLAKAGWTRSQQRDLLKNLGGMPGAAADPTQNMPGAVPAVAAANNPNPEDEKMNLEELKAKHPDLYAAVVKEGQDAGMKAGADAERARIQGVLAAALPGHEALVNTLAFDGATTPGDAALKVNAAERAKLGDKGTQLRNDAAPLATVPASGADAGKDADADLTAEARWEKNIGNVRAEYASQADFLAFEKANAGGKVKILGGRKQA